jgi:hypothetical protein
MRTCRYSWRIRKGLKFSLSSRIYCSTEADKMIWSRAPEPGHSRRPSNKFDFDVSSRDNARPCVDAYTHGHKLWQPRASSPHARLGTSTAFSDEAAGVAHQLEVHRPTSSGQGTMVDFTVFIAIASATARAMPSSENG